MTEEERDEEEVASTENEIFGPEEDEDKCLSDSEDESELFDPMPYAFILKDVYRNQLVLSPEKLHNARISCPSFHILLDHLVAVLWCFYSKSGHNKLGTSQLHWAIKLLEGLGDRKNHTTADVSMAIEHLEEALVEIGASVDESRITNRIYDDLESTKQPLMDLSKVLEKRGSYEDFAAFLMDARKAKGEGEEEFEDEEEFTIIKKTYKSTWETNKMRIESPSIIINDMLGDNQDQMVELLQATMREGDDDVRSFALGGKSATGLESSTSVVENYASFRNELIDKTIRQLEQIRNLDETLNGLKCQPDPEEIAKLKETMKNSR